MERAADMTHTRLRIIAVLLFAACLIGGLFAQQSCPPWSCGFSFNAVFDVPVWLNEPYDATYTIALAPALPGCPPHAPQPDCKVTFYLPDGSQRGPFTVTLYPEPRWTTFVLEDVIVPNCNSIELQSGTVAITTSVRKGLCSAANTYTYSIRTPDLCCDGHVGMQDLLMVINAWGPCATSDGCWEDLTMDGNVGVADLLFIINRWGEVVN